MPRKCVLFLFVVLFSFFSAKVISLNKKSVFSATQVIYCPSADELKKDPVKLTWSADEGNFRSYDISFANAIDQFVGAQWVGANLGQITCIYRALPKTTFLVLLSFHTLTLEPKHYAWSQNLGGYRNCRSLNHKQCPFVVRLKNKSVNLYQEAERLKKKEISPELYE